MSDTLVKEVAKKLPQAAHQGHGGLKKPEMVQALFDSIFSVLTDKKHAPKKHEARAKARDLANSWLTKHCSQSNGHYFWKAKE
jgi:hypothetical protein